MEKILILMLMIVVLAAAMCGCGEKTLLSPEDPVTLTMWHVYGEQADSPMNLMIKEFNETVGAEKGITISVTNVSSTSKIALQLADAQAGKPGAPELPDLFSCHTAGAVILKPENLVDWNDYFSADELAGYVPEFIQDGTMDDRLVIFPVSKSSYALFINGSQFSRFSEDTGITYDNLRTWDGFFDAAARYYEWSGGKTFCALDYLIRHVEFDMMSEHGQLEYTENGWYDVTNPEFKASWMKFAVPLAQGHIAVSDLYANTQVMTGEALSGIGSTAAIAYYNDTVTYSDNTSEPTDLKVLPLPSCGTSGKDYMPQTGVGLAAYKTDDKKAEAASVFLRWFTEGQRNLDFVAETGYMPVNNDAYEAIGTYEFTDAGYASLYEAIGLMRQTYTPVVRPDFDGYYDMVNKLYNDLRQCQGQLSQRSDNGEDPVVLAGETWEIFCSVN